MYCVNYDVVNIFEMQNNKLGTDFSVGLWAACTNRPLQNVNTAHCPRLANKSQSVQKILVFVQKIQTSDNSKKVSCIRVTTKAFVFKNSFLNL